MTGDAEIENAERLREAEEVAYTVQVLRRLLLRSFEADIAESGLTAPQVSVLEELAGEDGLSLKELSWRMGLSHSTVSGIVDRLGGKGLVERRPDSDDRRYSRLFLSEGVRDYVRSEVPFRRLGPVMEALALADDEERSRILSGLHTLRRCLEAVVCEGGEGETVESR